MSAAGMSLGVDYNLILFDANTGTTIDLGDIQQFTARRLKHDIKSMPYNDDPRYANISDGYEGTFRLVRTGPTIQNLQIALDAKMNTGAPMLPGFINETTQEKDKTVSKYQYVNVDFSLDEAADVSHDKNVPQTVHWRCSRKVQLL